MSAELAEGFAKTLYFDRTFDADAAKLMPGEFYVTGNDMALVTVLVLTRVTWSVSLDERTAISAFRRQRFVVGSRHWSAVHTVVSFRHVPLTPPDAR